jgi:hypothetical protein
VISIHSRQAALEAVPARPGRPAAATLHESDDSRIVVFRIGSEEAVRPHRNRSTVQLVILEGIGVITGEARGTPIERPCIAGDVIVFEPGELHGMRSTEGTLLVLAIITPRPGSQPAVTTPYLSAPAPDS